MVKTCPTCPSPAGNVSLPVTPPAELVKKAHGHLNSLLGSASMISMQPGYEGSTTPWTITIADQEAAKVGKSADDRPKDFNVVSLGSINGV